LTRSEARYATPSPTSGKAPSEASNQWGQTIQAVQLFCEIAARWRAHRL